MSQKHIAQLSNGPMPTVATQYYIGTSNHRRMRISWTYTESNETHRFKVINIIANISNLIG